MQWVIVEAIALAGCSSRKPDEVVQPPEVLATTSAQRILASVPASLGGGVEVTGAKAEARTVVLAIGGMTDWRGDYSDATMATTMSRRSASSRASMRW